MKTEFLAGLAIFSLLGGSALAQNSGANRGSANRLSGTDNTFIMKAAQGGMAEVELGKLAQQRASNDAVKQFGKRMVQDHSMANEQLKTIAANQGVTLPTGLDPKDQAIMDRLSKLNGAEFDKAYIRDMVADHRTDIGEFQKEADHGNDPAVKQFASMTLPTLQEHLRMAEDAQKSVR
ncbi:MAG: DUF4142 domain-containing protein [Acidobacteriia bacterium]|nr:DUF4142 domain-containing protein [Terriglobia bacterium]